MGRTMWSKKAVPVIIHNTVFDFADKLEGT